MFLLRSGTGFWLSAIGENLESGTGFRVLVVEERKESERLGKMWLDEALGKSLVVPFV